MAVSSVVGPGAGIERTSTVRTAHDQEHDVGGPPRPRRVTRRGEDADADASVLRGCDHGRAVRCRLPSSVSLRHRPRCSHAPPALGRPSARALSRAATLGPLRLEPDRLRPASSTVGRRRDPSLVDWRHHIRRPAPPASPSPDEMLPLRPMASPPGLDGDIETPRVRVHTTCGDPGFQPIGMLLNQPGDAWLAPSAAEVEA